MTERAVDEAFDAQNRADDAAKVIQVLGNPAAEQDDGRALREPSRSLPRTVAVVMAAFLVTFVGRNYRQSAKTFISRSNFSFIGGYYERN